MPIDSTEFPISSGGEHEQLPQAPDANNPKPAIAGQHIEADMRAMRTEEEQRMRREQCHRLAFQVCASGSVEEAEAKSLLRILNIDYFTATFSQVYDTITQRVKEGNYGSWDALEKAIDVAKFYYLHPDIPIPDGVVNADLNEKIDPKTLIPANKKMLVVISRPDFLSTQRSKVVKFEKQRQNGTIFNKQTVETPLPDVYIRNFDEEIRKVFRESFELSGIDNLIIGGPVDSQHTYTFKICCEGRCAILPKGSIGESGTHLKLLVGGDLYQYGGVNAAELTSCHNYEQIGGHLGSAEYSDRKKMVQVKGGRYNRKGGTVNLNHVVIEGDRQHAEALAVTTVVKDEALGLPTGQLAQELVAPTELSELDREWLPKKTLLRTEADGSVVEIRAYIVETDRRKNTEGVESLMDLEIAARAEGWTIIRTEQETQILDRGTGVLGRGEGIRQFTKYGVLMERKKSPK